MGLLHTILDDVLKSDDRALFLAFSLASLLITVLLLVPKTSSGSQKTKFQSSHEPQSAPLGAPFVNHTFSYLRSPPEFLYNIRLFQKSPKPYTIKIGPSITSNSAQRIYALNGAEDLHLLWRNADTFVWFPWMLKFFEWMFPFEKRDKEIIYEGLDDPHSFFGQFHHMYNRLHIKDVTKGGVLIELNKGAALQFSEILTELVTLVNSVPEKNTKVDVSLFSWLKPRLFRVAAFSIFGPRNIYTEPTIAVSPQKIFHGYTVWEHRVPYILSKITGDFFEKEAIRGRDLLLREQEVFLNDAARLELSNPLIRDRVALAKEFGYSMRGVASIDLSLLFSSLANLVPSLFWCIYHAFAPYPSLEESASFRAQIVEELLASGALVIDDKDTKTATISMTTAMSCKHLRALFDEVMRHYQDFLFSRVVGRDCEFKLSDQQSYTLKRNAIVQLSSRNLFQDETIWGEGTANVFDPKRFTRFTSDMDRASKRKVDHAFKPFGGGQTMCPGRNFAWSEIAGFVAGVVGLFEVTVPSERPQVEGRTGAGVVAPQTSQDFKFALKAGLEVERVEYTA